MIENIIIFDDKICENRRKIELVYFGFDIMMIGAIKLSHTTKKKLHFFFFHSFV